MSEERDAFDKWYETTWMDSVRGTTDEFGTVHHTLEDFLRAAFEAGRNHFIEHELSNFQAERDELRRKVSELEKTLISQFGSVWQQTDG